MGLSQPIPLECSLGKGQWEPCRMEVIEVGRKWIVIVRQRRIWFEHDGSGVVKMNQTGQWQRVTPSWRQDQSLCWADLCVRGSIPLD